MHFNHYEDPVAPEPTNDPSCTGSYSLTFDIQIPLGGYTPGAYVLPLFFMDEDYACHDPPKAGADPYYTGTVQYDVQDENCFDQIRFDQPSADSSGADVIEPTAQGVSNREWYLEGMAYDTYIDPSTGQIYAGTHSGRVKVGVQDNSSTTCSKERPIDIGGDCAGGGCEGGGCVAGNENVKMGSVDVTIGLGALNRDQSAGYLWISADRPSQFLGTPAAWNYQPPEGVDISSPSSDDDIQFYTLLGIPRALIVPEAVVIFEWVPTLGTESITQLSFYHPEDLNASTTLEPYDLVANAEPYLIWSAYGSGDGSTEGVFALGKSIDGGATGAVYYYNVDEYGDVVLTRDLGGTQVFTEAERITEDIDGNVVLREVFGIGSYASYHYEDEYTLTAIGNVVTSRTEYLIDYPAVTGTTTLEYYSSSSQPSVPSHLYGHLRAITYPDGSWEWRNYDNSHRLIESRRPLGTYPLPATEDPDTNYCRRTTYEYDSNNQIADFERRATLIMEYEGTGDSGNPDSIVVSRTFVKYEFDQGFVMETVSRCLEDDALENDPDNLVTQTWYRDYDEGLPRAIIYPDGRMTAFVAEQGDYTDTSTPEQAAFTAGNGEFEQVSVIHGVEPVAGGLTPDLIALKSTKTTTVTDSLGNVLLRETYVYTGESAPDDFARIDFAVNQLDEYHHIIRTDRSNGEVETWNWGCCRLNSHAASDGVVAEYPEYDGVGRVMEQVKKGFNGTADISTTMSRDGLGRITSTTVSGGTFSLTTERAFDNLGRVNVETDAADVDTTYEYEDLAGGGRRVTENLPGNLQRITDYRMDGRTDSITGSAVVARFFDYGVDENGRRLTTVRTGNVQTGPYVTTFYDLLGRQVEQLRPSVNNFQLRQRWIYDGSRLVQTINETLEPDGQGGQTATTISSICYDYDELGSRTFTCEDLDFDGYIGYAGPDRVTETESVFYKDGSDTWWSVVTTEIYPYELPDPPSARLVVSEVKTQLTDLESTVASYSSSRDVFYNQTYTSTEIDRTNHKVTETTTFPGITQPQVNVVENGLLISSTSTAGITTTFAYDDIGRRTEVNDPRKGPSETVYDSVGRVQYIEDAADKRVTFEYDQWGRRDVVKNHDNLATRYAYNTNGQIYRVWGDVPQPIELGFDPVYHRRTTLKTFRATNVDWTQTTWPPVTGAADTTTWTFDDATSVLLSKKDAAQQEVSYQYNGDLSLKKRYWARTNGGSPLFTEYLYYDTGELKTVNYSDSTPDVGFTYDRLGRLATVTDAMGTHTFTYNGDLQLESESIAGALYSRVITRNYETSAWPLGRYTGVMVGSAQDPSDDYDSTLGYDTAGRLNKVTGPGLTPGGAKYTYLDDSNLIEELQHLDAAGTTVLAKTVRTYEPDRDLLTSIENRWESLTDPVVGKYSYEYDNLARRKWRVNDLPGTSADTNDRFTYNARNELTGSVRWTGLDPEATTTQVTGGDFDYGYDPIGNRVSGTLPGSVSTAYAANNLNQYTGVHYPDVQCYINETNKLTASDAAAGDRFGEGADTDGTRLLAGAPYHDQYGSDGGTCYVREGTDWADEDEPDLSAYVGAGDRFGTAVDIDGDLAIVGAVNTKISGGQYSGTAFVLRYNSGTDAWDVEAELIPSDGATGDLFGVAVAIDGDVAAVGAKFADIGGNSDVGAVYVFRHEGSPPTWQFEQKLNGPSAHAAFGGSLALDGNRLLVGAPNHDVGASDTGAAYVYEFYGTVWTVTQTLTADDAAAGQLFGSSVALQSDIAVVGAPGDSQIAAGQGAAYVFDTWKQAQKLTAHDGALTNLFGASVALDGDRILVGSWGDDEAATNAGSGYLFEYSSSGWVETAKLLASDGAQSDLLGRYAAAIAGNAALFGVPFADTTAGTNAGAVYAFDIADADGNQVPDACEQNFTYDTDGNMTGDEDFTYTRDGENRLTKVEPKFESEGVKRVTYTYDYLGRRVGRLEETLAPDPQTPNPSGLDWGVTADLRYVYDGWNVVLEFDWQISDDVPVKRYTWGLDLSQTLQGAGGVGGLLACRDYVHNSAVSMYVAYLYMYDGNGNVTALVDSAPDSEGGYNGTVLARYDYDPYGNTLSAGGTEASNNAYRFSTKPQEELTGDYYYGYRYYAAGLGRWRSRDVIGEVGGVNLMGFLGNQPGNSVDLFGLFDYDFHHDITLMLATLAGIDCADEVAAGAQRPDNKTDYRSPIEHGFGSLFAWYLSLQWLNPWSDPANWPYLKDVIYWHFRADKDGIVRPNSKAGRKIAEAGLASCDIKLFSEGLHPLQDTFTHFGKPYFAGAIGHNRGVKWVQGYFVEPGKPAYFAYYWKDISGTREAALSHSTDNVKLFPESARDAAMATYKLMLQFKEGCPCACGNGTEATSSGLHWSEEDVKELIADLFPGKDAIDSNGKSRERREQKQWSDWPIDEHGRPLY